MQGHFLYSSGCLSSPAFLGTRRGHFSYSGFVPRPTGPPNVAMNDERGTINGGVTLLEKKGRQIVKAADG
jgi:hypothetical protein